MSSLAPGAVSADMSEPRWRRAITVIEGVWGCIIAIVAIGGWIYHFAVRVEKLEWQAARQDEMVREVKTAVEELTKGQARIDSRMSEMNGKLDIMVGRKN